MCAKCSEKDRDHLEKDCLKQNRRANFQKDHQAYISPSDFNKKEREIPKVKHKRNVSFLEARKIVVTYMGESNYASVVRRGDITNQDNNYRTLENKLIQLETNDWPKSQEHLKKLHSTEFYQAPAQQ